MKGGKERDRVKREEGTAKTRENDKKVGNIKREREREAALKKKRLKRK